MLNTTEALPVIPKFAGSWSNKMEEWLKNVRDSWDDGSDQSFQEWLARNTIDLCRSWGCREKAYAIRDIISNFLPETLWYEIAKSTMNAWVHFGDAGK